MFSETLNYYGNAKKSLFTSVEDQGCEDTPTPQLK